MGLARSIKRSFWRGLAALLPALLTVVVLILGVNVVYTYLGRPVNTAIIHIVAWVLDLRVESVQEFYAAYRLAWLGWVVAIVAICMAAYFLGTFIGNYILRFVEAWIVRMPILRRIYPGAKQVSEYFFSERAVEFRRVVAFEYPRRGVWSIGFVTGRSFRALTEQTEQELLTVFIPSSPTPITGYIVAVPRRELIDLPITVDEAFQYTISGGVIVPPAERVESLSVALLVGKDEARAAMDEVAEGLSAPTDSSSSEPPAPSAETPDSADRDESAPTT